jgi:hypothetical protein
LNKIRTNFLEVIEKLNEALEIRERRERTLRTGVSGTRILFVDDQENIGLTLPAILRERGFQVTAAAGVQEAEKILKARTSMSFS